ncbi:MAG TPA: hypothetical protein VK338_02910 [Candidatus Nitrosocosmicus sp.]|nr:hypothetical protein [Candidatus Nitrosocosmicus sp.]
MAKLKYKKYATPEKGKQLCILVDVQEVDNKFYNPQQDKEDKSKRLDWLFAYEKKPEMRVHIWTSTTMTVFNGKKSNALKLIEALMDKELSQKEVEDGFEDTADLLGKKCYLLVKHEKDVKGNTQAKVTDFEGISDTSF